MDIRYLAGFFDGEGCISIYKHDRGNRPLSYGLVVKISQKDPMILKKIQKEFGGSISPRGLTFTEEIMHELVWYGDKATTFLRIIYSFIIIKKTQAQMAFTFQKRKGFPLTKFELCIKEGLFQAMKAAKK